MSKTSTFSEAMNDLIIKAIELNFPEARQNNIDIVDGRGVSILRREYQARIMQQCVDETLGLHSAVEEQ
ncbi:MAG: hypothetical protein QOH63_1973 [Acidobacteriota bacterium]|jgi:hypothetical protein|nr:hypothetical protein [Acidobacteriota bacterium]